MSYRREHRSSKSALLDGLEEGGLRASSSYSRDINEHDNDKAVQSLQDRVVFLKRLTGDIHEEVESHSHLLDRMGNHMDASRGILSGTMDRFKMVFEKKSSRRMCRLVAYFVVSFLIIYVLFSMHCILIEMLMLLTDGQIDHRKREIKSMRVGRWEGGVGEMEIVKMHMWKVGVDVCHY
ncbi:unnamed protein product [Prunus armeniaca]|uniref:t-SNARE coiled-coil homology domain-containing protein n=1 Tax=Prunus armeniaca TaxID=36596 RepID=A0A6J5TCT7_PRUAR|nr:unnamed protein product [Prunus armeniaca]